MLLPVHSGISFVLTLLLWNRPFSICIHCSLGYMGSMCCSWFMRHVIRLNSALVEYTFFHLHTLVVGLYGSMCCPQFMWHIIHLTSTLVKYTTRWPLGYMDRCVALGSYGIPVISPCLLFAFSLCAHGSQLAPTWCACFMKH